MPLPIAHVVLVLWRELGDNGAASIVDAEDEGAVDHLKDQEVAAAVNGHEDARRRPRLDLHADIDVQTDAERFLGLDVTASKREERAALHFRRARLRSFAVCQVDNRTFVGPLIKKTKCLHPKAAPKQK